MKSFLIENLCFTFLQQWFIVLFYQSNFIAMDYKKLKHCSKVDNNYFDFKIEVVIIHLTTMFQLLVVLFVIKLYARTNIFKHSNGAAQKLCRISGNTQKTKLRQVFFLHFFFFFFFFVQSGRFQDSSFMLTELSQGCFHQIATY